MLDAAATEALRAFCRRATAIESGREDRSTYIRIRAREGRAWAVVASQITPGERPDALEDELRERLGALAPGPIAIELLERGSSAPRETCRIVIGGPAAEPDEPDTLARAAVGLMAEARQMLADASARAAEAQREARLAQAEAHQTALGALQIAMTAQSPAAAAMERLIEQVGPSLVPLLLARRGPPTRQGASEAAQLAPRERALQALATLEELVSTSPELLEDGEILSRVIALGDAVGSRLAALTASP